MPRKICVVTGSRAEYGQLVCLLSEIDADPALDLQLVVTGMHLSPEFGSTWREIEKDGFRISARVDIGLSRDSTTETVKCIGRGITGMADVFETLAPDIVLVTGDRFEMLPASQAALMMRIPAAHLHGGEVTEGALDDSIRHAITKMSHLHFVASDEYRRRVIQLGEAPDRVFAVGAPAHDYIFAMKTLSREALEQDLSFPLGEGFLLVTYHPSTLASDQDQEAVGSLLRVLGSLTDRQVLITGVNADSGHEWIREKFVGFVEARPEKAKLVTSLGQLRYLSAMKACGAVVGNSHSGLIEAPIVGVPSVNIGDRQKGRDRAPSVIDCRPDEASIQKAIARSLDPAFREETRARAHGAERPNASRRIKEILKSVDLTTLVRKRFYDLPAPETAYA